MGVMSSGFLILLLNAIYFKIEDGASLFNGKFYFFEKAVNIFVSALDRVFLSTKRKK
jgi:hypothetical protein